MANRFEAALERRVLLCDGAMGTMLQATGLLRKMVPEELNAAAPEAVGAVHAAYVAAGADMVETNSFGGSRLKLAGAGLAERTRELNVAAARIAREAAGERGVVAGKLLLPRLRRPLAHGKPPPERRPVCLGQRARRQLLGLPGHPEPGHVRAPAGRGAWQPGLLTGCCF